MHRGFSWFRFGRRKSTEEKINDMLADIQRWMGEEGTRVPSKPEQTVKPAPTESVPKVLRASESQAPRVASGPPQPKDFGVTPEQVAAYRPPGPPWLSSPRHSIGDFLLELYFLFLVLLAIASILALALRWPATIIVSAGAILLWLLLHQSRANPLSRELRGRVEDYLRAKGEYEKRVSQAELERRRRQEECWHNLSGRDFESEMARLYKLAGYSVETTAVTGDEGADLLLRKDGELIVVQCKRQDKPVGPHIVRDLYGTMHHFGAARAFLDATGGFTEGVRQYARGKPIELHDLNYILSLQEAVAKE
jgi:hypothetical protein